MINIDPSGHKKGDKFKTMDEAAKDFAINYNLKSIEENVEYATTIYKVKEKQRKNGTAKSDSTATPSRTPAANV